MEGIPQRRIPGVTWTGLAAGLVCVFALLCAVRPTLELRWPGQHDFSRDMATAQLLLDQGRLEDPYYAGEAAYYPPATAVVTAAWARLAGIPVPEAAARCGPWLNLLGPVAFYLLASWCLGRVLGLAALACFLFLPPAEHHWAVVATYSPWLIALNFAQGFFYLGVLALLRARASGSWIWHAAAGVLAGIVALTHLAPAAILAGLAIALMFARPWMPGRHPDATPSLPTRSLPRTLAGFALMGVVAAAVASPYWLPLWARYRLAVIHHDVQDFVHPEIGSVFFGLASPGGAITLLGAGALLLAARRRAAPAAIFAWPAVCVAGIAWHEAGGHDLVPVHHWHLYLSAFRSLAFGAGIGAVAFRFPRDLSGVRGVPRVAPWVAAAALALVVLPALLEYPQNVDSGAFRGQALAWEEAGGPAASRWIHDQVAPDATVLAPADFGTLFVAPAGRKIVLADPLFSNPFVDRTSRSTDLDRMSQAFLDGDHDAFFESVDAYRMTHAAGGVSSGFVRWMSPVFQYGRTTVWQIEMPWHEAGVARIDIAAPRARDTLRSHEPPRVVFSLAAGARRVAITLAFEDLWTPVRFMVPAGALARDDAGNRTFALSSDQTADPPNEAVSWSVIADNFPRQLARLGRPALRCRVKVEAFGEGPASRIGASLPRGFLLVP
jgi:hypothetical protein